MKDQITKAAEILKRGGIILYPTDTVWGIGCDATNDEAVDKIYRLKQSSDKKSMLVLARDADHASRFTARVPQVAWQLMELSDKPLTLILPNACGVAGNLVPEDGTIGIRIPDHEFCQSLLRATGRPIVSTSANLSGEPAPKGFESISKEIMAGVDMVIEQRFEGRPTGKPSSIIKIGEGGEIEIIRE